LLISSNNFDLARIHGLPIATAEAMNKWAHHQVLECSGGNTPPLSERGVSLGIRDDRLIVGRLAGKLVSISDIVKKLDSPDVSNLKAIVKWPDCPDNMSQSDFEELELDDDVLDLSLGSATRRFDFDLPQWVSGIFPETEDLPRNVFGALVEILQSKLGQVEVEETEDRIGAIDGERFTARLMSFEKF
jgi:hypothetical protein